MVKGRNLSEVFQRISLCDTLQREGRQSAGFHLNKEKSLQHARIIDEIGIDVLELNHPFSAPIFDELVREISRMGLKTQVAAHVRFNLRDVKTAVETGVRRIHTYIPMDPKTVLTQRESLKKALSDLTNITELTKRNKIKLRVSVEHTFSLSLKIVSEIYKEISSVNGVDLVGVADTTGVCFPKKFTSFIKAIYEVIPPDTPIQFHLHNDHGLVAANFLEIIYLMEKNKNLKALFDISPGGLGERNGILSYGDVFSILYLLNPEFLKGKYNLKSYSKLIRFIERECNTILSRRDPLNVWAFSHSAGPHLMGMIQKSSYQVIPPEDFGLELKLNVGHCVTGYEGIRYFVKKDLNLLISEKQAKEIASKVRKVASIKGQFTDRGLKKFILKEID